MPDVPRNTKLLLSYSQRTQYFMIINGLWLQQFRSIAEQVWQFEPGLNLFVAPNGSGKSNLIESIRLLSTGKSWRTTKTDELIGWEAELARLKTKVTHNSGEEIELEQLLTHGIVLGKAAPRRTYKRNGVNKRRADLVGELPTVLFTPEDMLVFQTGPAKRRELLDGVLSQADREYRRSLQQYEQALKRRNRLILQLREGEISRYDFFYWDQLLIQNGEYLHEKRQDFLHWLENRAGIHEKYQVKYDYSIMSEARLRQYANEEVAAGHTLVGPHKDDWQISIERGRDWRDMVTYGSRGEQRLSLLWFKLGEVEYLKATMGESPVLLLDDVFSELDEQNCRYLLEATEGVQAIVTTVPGQEVVPEVARELF
jgi:DNA replication and repair protein RecF